MERGNGNSRRKQSKKQPEKAIGKKANKRKQVVPGKEASHGRNHEHFDPGDDPGRL